MVVNLLLLAFFKYFNMFLTFVEIGRKSRSLAELFYGVIKFESTGALDSLRIGLPLAISFTVFQSIAYLVDVYRGTVRSERNIGNFFLFIMLFMQVVQGPIMRFGDLAPQFTQRYTNTDLFANGVRRFSYGLAKKVMIANTLAVPVDLIWAQDISKIGTALAWLGSIFYALQIYYDFSGYSDMAVGIGLMFGFRIKENFAYPYTSLSTQEFWRRWHISLSQWFRDYLYIPLGGNRGGTRRTLWNITIVFLVTGIWHGANLTFLLWGLVFAASQIFERQVLRNFFSCKSLKPLFWLWTFLVVTLNWVLFRAPNLYSAGQYYCQMFSLTEGKSPLSWITFMDFKYVLAAFSGIVLCGFIQRAFEKELPLLRQGKVYPVIETLASTLLLVGAIILIIGGSYSPSIYGGF